MKCGRRSVWSCAWATSRPRWFRASRRAARRSIRHRCHPRAVTRTSSSRRQVGWSRRRSGGRGQRRQRGRRGRFPSPVRPGVREPPPRLERRGGELVGRGGDDDVCHRPEPARRASRGPRALSPGGGAARKHPGAGGRAGPAGADDRGCRRGGHSIRREVIWPSRSATRPPRAAGDSRSPFCSPCTAGFVSETPRSTAGSTASISRSTRPATWSLRSAASSSRCSAARCSSSSCPRRLWRRSGGRAIATAPRPAVVAGAELLEHLGLRPGCESAGTPSGGWRRARLGTDARRARLAPAGSDDRAAGCFSRGCRCTGRRSSSAGERRPEEIPHDPHG